MKPTRLLLVGMILTALGCQEGRAGPPRIAETQLTLRLGAVQGQATVIAIARESLTVATAAHFLSSEDVGKRILVQQSERMLGGQVVAVKRHPDFHPIRSRVTHEWSAAGTLGVDTEIATLRVALHNEGEHRVFEKIKSAEMTRQSIPSRGDQILQVHIVDQFGKEHNIRAGNHLNPKCLAWGSRYYAVQRGDSGAGLFILRKTPEGELWPILIGNVAQSDDRGGIASLVHRDEPWIDKALIRAPSEERNPHE